MTEAEILERLSLYLAAEKKILEGNQSHTVSGITFTRAELRSVQSEIGRLRQELALVQSGGSYGSKPAGKEVTFHILEQHPGDYIRRGTTFKSRRIPASEIIHVWDREMISQYSGMPWLHAVVMEGYRMDEFRHITQDTTRAQAIFAYFLKSSMPGFSFGPGITAGGQAHCPERTSLQLRNR